MIRTVSQVVCDAPDCGLAGPVGDPIASLMWNARARGWRFVTATVRDIPHDYELCPEHADDYQTIVFGLLDPLLAATGRVFSDIRWVEPGAADPQEFWV